MSARDEMDTLTVEARIRRIRTILMVLPCIADHESQFNILDACQELELMAQEEMGKIVGVLGTEVLNRDC